LRILQSISNSFRQIENITIYTKSVKDLGVNANDMFDISDLFEHKNFTMVLTHINALAHLCESSIAGWSYPKMADTSQAKNLLAEQLKGIYLLLIIYYSSILTHSSHFQFLFTRAP
jgi:hypothetical protein